MNAWKIALALAVLSGNAWAQAGSLVNASIDDRSALDDPAVASREVSDGWLAFSMPVLDGTRSPCCWKGKWNSNREVGCSLEPDRQSYGTRSDSPEVDHVITFARLSEGNVKSLRVMGESCPVDGAGADVLWIGSVDANASLNWLANIARDGKQAARDSALYAAALHESPQATQLLHDFAAADSGLSEEAVFWLGETRGAGGYKALDALLRELPHGDTRQHVNFALAQNNSPEAFDRLVDISRNDADPEQRSNALFWLAEEFPEQAEPLLLDALASESDEEVLEQAVFAVSQLPGRQSTRILLALAQDPDQPREIRRQAMFWLANSDDDEALAALEDLLTR